MKRRSGAARFLAAVYIFAILAASVPAEAAGASFSDVPKNAWYYNYVTQCATYGIIDGYPDGTFRPDETLKCGEFLKLLASIAELPALTQAEVHWADPYWKVLNDAGVLWGTDIQKTKADLDRAVTRYEMAVLIRNLCFNVFGENTVKSDTFAKVIGDYASISGKYVDAVEQSYGKGILNGYEDGEFHGGYSLSRAEAAAVVVRTAWPLQRKTVSGVTEVKTTDTGSGTLTPTDSFAFQYRGMTDAQRRLALFGSSQKSYFTGSESNLGDYIVTIEVPTWYLNESTGVKSTVVRSIQVNKAVAAEVKAIFQEIYNDPEKFPIKALGGARYSDTLRHSWGCAVDINPNENYYINYSTGQTVGSFCYKTGSSVYSITPDSSVVRAFAKYGWGWGGVGWSSAADYMHFSILESGG